MNFFGHAALATWQRPDPAFVLGSMLPDFASMIRTRLPTVDDEMVAAGIAFHHATDHIFHELATFRELSGSAFAWLRENGMPRGSARAVAHIGVEILIDAAVADDESACAGYVSALNCSASREFQASMDWRDALAETRFKKLCETLLARGVVRSDVAPDHVAFRVRRALAGRPRLELDDTGEAVVGKWVVAARPAIVAGAPAVITALKAKLVP